ncbi:MAG: hypothetical protein R2746_10425 [Acidimicrobiales bacterium]
MWFLGGSTMFGIGQRDDHTIESGFVRIADEAGTPDPRRQLRVELLRRLAGGAAVGRRLPPSTRTPTSCSCTASTT